MTKKLNEETVVILADAPKRSSRRVSISFENDPGKTEQSHAHACSITNIIAQHVRAGLPLDMPQSEFIDLTVVPDYQTALNTVMAIDDMFESLPSRIRNAFDNDPALLLQAMSDPSQRVRLTELGVLNVMDDVVAGVKSPAKDLETDGVSN